MEKSFNKIKSVLIMTVGLFLFLSSFLSAQDDGTQYLLRVRPEGDRKIIIDFNIAYAEGDSVTCPKLKFEQYQTEYIRMIKSENIVALIQGEDENQILEVTIETYKDGEVTGTLKRSGRILHIWKNKEDVSFSGF